MSDRDRQVAISRAVPEGDSLPGAFRMPEIDPIADAAFERVINPHPDIGMPKLWHPAILAAVARVKADVTDPLCTPASRETLAAFLWPIAGAVEYTPTESEFYRRVAALEIAAIDVPHVAWTRPAQRQILQECARMPAVATILAVVLPPVRRLISVQRAVAIILGQNAKNAATTD